MFDGVKGCPEYGLAAAIKLVPAPWSTVLESPFSYCFKSLVQFPMLNKRPPCNALREGNDQHVALRCRMNGGFLNGYQGKSWFVASTSISPRLWIDRSRPTNSRANDFRTVLTSASGHPTTYLVLTVFNHDQGAESQAFRRLRWLDNRFCCVDSRSQVK